MRIVAPHPRIACAAIALIALVPVHAGEATPASAYCIRVLDAIDDIISPPLLYHTDAAKRCAARMVAGGTLWLAGDRGFVLEGLNRAGGLMAGKWLQKPEDLKSGDFVLMGLIGSATESDRAILVRARAVGARSFVLGPVAPDEAQEYMGVPGPQAGCIPITSPVLATSLWTFTAELIAALTRQGKLPPMYQSVLVPGGRERNAEHLKLTWEPTTPAPIAPLILGRTYLARVANILRELRATQRDEFAQAGQMAADAIRSGHTAWYACLGHLPPELPGQPGDPGVLKPLRMNTPDRLGDFVKPGDVILYVGYYEPYGAWVEKAHGLGARIVTVVSGTPERRAEDMGADININARWPYGDAVVDIPGYDIRVLPSSGVVAATAYFMLVAETAGALSP